MPGRCETGGLGGGSASGASGAQLTDCEHVRRHRPQRLALVRTDRLGRVQALDLDVRVHRDEDVGHVGVDLVPLEADADVLEEGGLVELDEGAAVVGVGQLGLAPAACGRGRQPPEAGLVELVAREHRLVGALQRLRGPKTGGAGAVQLEADAGRRGPGQRLDGDILLANVDDLAEAEAELAAWKPDQLARLHAPRSAPEAPRSASFNLLLPNYRRQKTPKRRSCQQPAG